MIVKICEYFRTVFKTVVSADINFSTFVAVNIYCKLNKISVLRKFSLTFWCKKKPFGYRVIFNEYSLMSLMIIFNSSSV